MLNEDRQSGWIRRSRVHQVPNRLDLHAYVEKVSDDRLLGLPQLTRPFLQLSVEDPLRRLVLRVLLQLRHQLGRAHPAFSTGHRRNLNLSRTIARLPDRTIAGPRYCRITGGSATGYQEIAGGSRPSWSRRQHR